MIEFAAFLGLGTLSDFKYSCSLITITFNFKKKLYFILFPHASRTIVLFPKLSNVDQN